MPDVSLLLPAGAGPARAGPPLSADVEQDLGLDQVFRAVLSGVRGHDLRAELARPLPDPELIGYRQAVFRDLRKPLTRATAEQLTQAMADVRQRAEQRRDKHYALQRQHWDLHTVARYCAAVKALASDLADSPLDSEAMRAAAQAVGEYRHSAAFQRMAQEAERLVRDLAALRFDVLVQGGRLTVGGDVAPTDYGDKVTALFDRFAPVGDGGSGKERRSLGLDHVQASVVEQVARLHPELFGRLASFTTSTQSYVDPLIQRLDRELHFYLGWLWYLRPVTEAGLPTCLPDVGATGAEQCCDVYDLALAVSLLTEQDQDDHRPTVVLNDVGLSPPERVIVVTGPNQGGKTTTARTIGQLHHLAAVGLPVPGSQVRLQLVDAVLTHFERSEDLRTLSGKLEDDLRRVRAILDAATDRSLVLLNEMFGSTTSQDALFLSERVLGAILDRGSLCVCVTFLDELSRLDDRTVSMVGLVDEDDPARRTYRVVRRAADGRAYASAVARKHGLTYDRLREEVERADATAAR